MLYLRRKIILPRYLVQDFWEKIGENVGFKEDISSVR